MWNKIKVFFQEIRLEFKKVTWPTKAETYDSTKVVIVIVLVIAAYLGLVDIVLSSGVKMLLNESPVAVFSVNPAAGDVNTTFSFDASGSYDVEENSSNLFMRWDFDGDGKWDEPAKGYTKNKVAQHKFTKADIYSVRVEVKDSQGSTSVAKMKLDVKPAETLQGEGANLKRESAVAEEQPLQPEQTE